MDVEDRQERARVYTREIWDMHKVSPNSADAMCSSPQRCRPPLFNTDKRRLCQIWLSPVAKQVERHHFHCLPFAARFSTFSTFSILNPMASYLSTTAKSFDIQIPVATQHHLSEPPMLVSQVIFLIVAPTSLSPIPGPAEKRSLARLGNLRQLYESLQTRQ